AGNVRIGGGARGTDPSVRNAQTSVIDAGAVIDASATASGNGGTVAVWSDGSTTFNGTITAMGGPSGGNGGWVETSGRKLAIAGSASVNAAARSPGGKPGIWLLDPTDLEVTTADSNVTAPNTISPADTSDN